MSTYEKLVRTLRSFSPKALHVPRTSRVKRTRIRLHPGAIVRLGESCLLECKILSDRANALFAIGDRTFIGSSLLVAAERISVGSDVLISWGVTIIDHQSHSLDFAERSADVVLWTHGRKDWTNVRIQPVTIGDKVWIGFGASIMPGVHIGEGAVIGAGSVVTKDVEPWTLVAGNPARPIRQLNSTASAASHMDARIFGAMGAGRQTISHGRAS